APVLIVEDEPLLQERLRALLCQLGYAETDLIVAGSLREARDCLSAQTIKLALIDLMLPDGSGLTLISQLRSEDPNLGILVVSAWSSEESILSALRVGATGYVLKERDDIEVSMSIRSVLRGGAPIDPFIARRILQLLPQGGAADIRSATAAHSTAGGIPMSAAAHGPRGALPTATPDATAQVPSTTSFSTATGTQTETLTEREGQILCLVADGLTNREIAERLFLSRYTVESHIKRIYRKLAVSSRTMAVRAGRARGVIE